MIEKRVNELLIHKPKLAHTVKGLTTYHDATSYGSMLYVLGLTDTPKPVTQDLWTQYLQKYCQQDSKGIIFAGRDLGILSDFGVFHHDAQHGFVLRDEERVPGPRYRPQDDLQSIAKEWLHEEIDHALYRKEWIHQLSNYRK